MTKKISFVRGFTLIELLVVIAIMAVLASVITGGVFQYLGKAKVARAKAEIKEIGKALETFKATYGGYPGITNCPAPYCYVAFYSSIIGGPGDPWLKTSSCNNGNDCPHLSQFYNLDWENYNANYFVTNGLYIIYLWDNNNDSEIGCGYVSLLEEDNGFYHSYGTEYILCKDCNTYCQQSQNSGIRTNKYY